MSPASCHVSRCSFSKNQQPLRSWLILSQDGKTTVDEILRSSRRIPAFNRALRGWTAFIMPKYRPVSLLDAAFFLFSNVKKWEKGKEKERLDTRGVLREHVVLRLTADTRAVFLTDIGPSLPVLDTLPSDFKLLMHCWSSPLPSEPINMFLPHTHWSKVLLTCEFDLFARHFLSCGPLRFSWHSWLRSTCNRVRIQVTPRFADL